MKSGWIALVFAVAGAAVGGPWDRCLFTVRSDNRECGSAFLMKQDHAVWMVSNCHVIRGSGFIEYVGMTDSSCKVSLPETIEVAANRDAVRFQTGGPQGFPLTGTYDFDETVFAFGNSGGAGVVTKGEGKVIGKGRGAIEVTCEIIPGNSGGPVVNTQNEVIGISTYLILAPSKQYYSSSANLWQALQARNGTRYEETRRFAVPLFDAEWQTVSRDVFKAESLREQSLGEQYEEFLTVVHSVFLNRPVREDESTVFSGSWLRSYNRKLMDLGYYYSNGDSYVIRAGRQDTFRRTLKKWISDLDVRAAGLAADYTQKAEDFTVLYFRRQLLEQVRDLQALRKKMAAASADIDR